MKEYQYRKYKEIYQVNLEIIKELTGKCSEIDANMEIKKKMKDIKEEDKKYYIFIDKEQQRSFFKKMFLNNVFIK